MPKTRFGKMNWIGIATGIAPPLFEAISAVWAKHRQRRTNRENAHQAHEMEALRRCLSEKDTEIAHLQSRLAACEEGLAQAQHAIEHLQQELAAERSKPWWEEAISWFKDRMGFRVR